MAVIAFQLTGFRSFGLSGFKRLTICTIYSLTLKKLNKLLSLIRAIEEMQNFKCLVMAPAPSHFVAPNM